ncbi:ATP-dependent nuclease [Mammaliicoccus lentus]|uniref:ATP-dependent nuclease n=1 Tax=Mammaliicoccus lentus TaxID=42858 RepID=UPI003A599C2B
MILNYLTIENFRNFKYVDLDLTNRNIIFGLNDIGKSNFLSALRFLLDRNYRKNGFVDSDFYNRDISQSINITLKIDISDNEEDEDNRKIFSMMRGAITTQATSVFIQIRSTYDHETLVGEPLMYWGEDKDNLEEIPSSQTFYELDRYFNVVFIDSSIQLENTFKRYSREILKNHTSFSDEERELLKTNISKLNESVSKLETIQKFEEDLSNEYRRFKEEKDFKLSIQSEIELNNIHNKLTPYIQHENTGHYPTSGDGRKKLLAYTLLTLENRRIEERKINIFLVEELENHLHRSMQISLSYQIFNDELFKYLFMTTHSSLMVSQMDNVNLVKLFKNPNVVGASVVYKVPEEYMTLKQKLNQQLAEAIYADIVLLVEGPSEKILFERVLNNKCERYESYGGYILEVDGINFKEYFDILTNLGITVIVKTDNDLQKVSGREEYNLLGLNRCRKLVNKNNIEKINDINPVEYESNIQYSVDKKREIYVDNYSYINELEQDLIYLSRVDLEYDLAEIIPETIQDLATNNNSQKDGVEYLQSAKLINMIELCKVLNTDSINEIYNHDNFKCLKVMVDLCGQ